MSRFNLIDENRIMVLDLNGNTKEISLLELFTNAKDYKELSGEMKAQDFAVLRMILAILQTIFSRLDYNGEPYKYFSLDEKYRQIESIDKDDLIDYKKDSYQTWKNLWNRGTFPDIVLGYLDKWHDRFYLFDDKYPFFQMTEEIIRNNAKNKKGTPIKGRNINRLISESGNKISLFSPKYGKQKDLITDSELIRWALTYNGYTGTGDKAIFGNEKYKVPISKGRIYDLGGIYFSGNNLFETLMLNLVLVHPKEEFRENAQTPSWERSPAENLTKFLNTSEVDNLSELYTRYSRGIFIDPHADLNKPFSFEVVKLPQIRHQNQGLELMTMRRFNKIGDNKDKNTPKKHRREESLWRSFKNLAALSEKERQSTENQTQKTPRPWGCLLMDHLDGIVPFMGEYQIQINAISMEDDGTSASWVPTNEVYEAIDINDRIVTDLSEKGWVVRIEDAVEITKKIINETYGIFLEDIKFIRNIQNKNFVKEKTEELYYLLNEPFNTWLSNLKPDDDKDEKIIEWRNILGEIVRKEAEMILKDANPRDYKGNIKKGKFINIATSYNTFNYFLNVRLKKEFREEEKDAGK